MLKFLLLVSVMSLWSTHSFALNCSNFWNNPDGSEINCEEHLPAKFGNNRFFYQKTAWPSQDLVENRLELASQAVKDATALYAQFAKIPAIYVILVSADGGSSGDLDIWAIANPEMRTNSNQPCPVRVFSKALVASNPKFMQTIAHELFHCVQHENYPAQYVGEGVAQAEWDKTTAWWAEGMAEYYSSLVYPSANLEWSKTKLYDGSQTPFEQESGYSVMMLFQSMSEEVGLDAMALSKQVKSFPVKGSASDQRAAFSKLWGVRQGFHDFAKSLMNDQVSDPGGGYFPSKYIPDVTHINVETESKSYDLAILPWTIKTYQFRLKKGYSYKLLGQKDRIAQPGTRFSVRKVGMPYWMDLSITDQQFDMSCYEEDQEFELLVTRTDNSGLLEKEVLQVQVEELPCKCDTKKFVLDKCFIGSWLLDKKVYEDVFADGPAKLESMSGEVVLSFTKQGETMLNFQNFTLNTLLNMSGDIGPKKINTQLKFIGNFIANAGSDTESGLLCVTPKQDLTALITTVQLDGDKGIVTSHWGVMSGGGSSSSLAKVFCHEDLITYEFTRTDSQGNEQVHKGHLTRLSNQP